MCQTSSSSPRHGREGQTANWFEPNGLEAAASLEEGRASPSPHSPCLKPGHSSALSQDTFDIRILMAKSVKYTVNFLEAKEGDLHRYQQPSTPGTPSSWAQLVLEVRATAGSLGQNPASQAGWARAPTPLSSPRSPEGTSLDPGALGSTVCEPHP